MADRTSDKSLAQYLLGELSETDNERIERQYLADRNFFDELLAVEDDLLDEYVRGELNGRQRVLFEHRLLATPRQQERLRDAQTLIARIDQAPLSAFRDTDRRERSKWFSLRRSKYAVTLPLAFAALVLLAGTGWLLTRTARLQGQVERMRAEQRAADRREQELREQLAGAQQETADLLRQLQEASEGRRTEGHKDAALPEKRIVPSMATFTLVPGLLRSGDASSFVVPPGVEIVQFDIQIPSTQYKSYRAQVQSADGETIYQQSGLAARAAKSGVSLRIRIPGRLLRGRDYVVKISGLSARGNFEDAGLYSFRILQK